MIIGTFPLADLVIEGVLCRGLPNQERVVLRVNMDCFTANVGLMLGYKQPGGYLPLRDRMYWFGTGFLKAGGTINVFTGQGEQKSLENGNGTFTYNLFWGLQFVAFDRPELEPILFRLAEATIGSNNATPRMPSLVGPQLALPKILGD